VRTPDLFLGRTGLKAKDLISLLLRHFPAGRGLSAAPRTRILLRVLTPTGLPAVQIRHQ
jgi:hypothetical protein